MSQPPNGIRFKRIELLKKETLGIGAYGVVCKAKCDDLLCAAKIIHQTLLLNQEVGIVSHKEHRLPMTRFEQECEFMSAIRHPNIVQYLGIHRDPETGLPVLLMELMDESLTHFLESSQKSIPFRIQVNIYHDIAVALSFLHSNGIVHRDMSSNNVLLICKCRAKITDFGMAKLGDINPQATRVSHTLCPGTEAYMPPEATTEDRLKCTEKIDSFSFGVLGIQILTHIFPKPGDRMKTVFVNHPDFPNGIRTSAPEIERRQNHVSQVDPNHSLLPIALDCLKDKDVERPSAQELCRRVAGLKQTSEYTGSERTVTPEKDTVEVGGEQQQLIRCQEFESLKHQLETSRQQIQRLEQQIVDNELVQQLQIQNLQQQIDGKQQQIQGLERQIFDNQVQHAHQIEDLQQEHAHQIEDLRRQRTSNLQENEHLLQELRDKDALLETSEQLVVTLQTKNSQLDQLQSNRDPPQTKPEIRASIELNWREGNKAPCEMVRKGDAVVNGNEIYFRKGSEIIYVYNSTSTTWSSMVCPADDCTLTVVNNNLTTIGGIYESSCTNQLFSLTGEGSHKMWREILPPMPTKRSRMTAICTRQYLIVIGGGSRGMFLLRSSRRVEVLKIDTMQWFTAADMPLQDYSAIICGDRVTFVSLRMDNTKIQVLTQHWHVH